jgi:hypothetical protein
MAEKLQSKKIYAKRLHTETESHLIFLHTFIMAYNLQTLLWTEAVYFVSACPHIFVAI